MAALRLGLAVAAAVAVADQLVKWWAIPALSATPGGIEVLPFFNLVMVWNRGVSFGLLGGAAVPPWLLAGLAGLVAAGLAVWLARADGRWLVIGIGLIVGGAVGNIVDRLLPDRRAVADFFDFHVGAYHWPAFNVADAAISVGLAALVIDSLLIRRGRHKTLLTDYNGREVRLTVERIRHILDHPEMVDMLAAVEQTLAAPTHVVRSRTDEQIVLVYRSYRGTRVGNKWLCVVVKYSATDAFVLTAYLTDRPKKGARIWPVR